MVFSKFGHIPMNKKKCIFPLECIVRGVIIVSISFTNKTLMHAVATIQA